MSDRKKGAPQKVQTNNELKKIINENPVEWVRTTCIIFDGEDSKGKRFDSPGARETPPLGHPDKRRIKGAIITPPKGRGKGKAIYSSIRMRASDPSGLLSEEEDKDEDEMINK
ncbi:hypothetical protein AAHA92_19992 [Salvia divinorum]|uniref:Uncharacterized protein n=1 Tax=Salvia divinorum TaxID=28513 RepID=A0ABD1GIT8_SALDI